MTHGEFSSQLLTVAFINRHRDRKAHPRPFTLPWPWPDRELVTAEELAIAEARLKRRSPFRD